MDDRLVQGQQPATEHNQNQGDCCGFQKKRKQTINHFRSMVLGLDFHFLGVHITRTCPGVCTKGSWQRRLSRDFISCESSGKITSLKSCCCPTINVLSKAFYATACVLLPSLDKLQSSRRHRKYHKRQNK